MQYDLDLFLALNEEYRSTPIVPQPRSLTGGPLLETSLKRAADLNKKLGGIEGRRVLEVGSGRGHFCRVLADEYGCHVTGVDIREYPEWSERPDIRLHRHDIATLQNDFLGKFDVIVSFAVWEHVEHPHAALQATRELLDDRGKMYLYANLYRGPKASHRYRDIFFPWPHLLFTDGVVEDFYVSQGKSPKRPAWVNKLTYAHYLHYFDQLGFDVERAWASVQPLDEQFYHRFEDVLGRYPRFDLERDFIYAIVKPRLVDPEVTADQISRLTTLVTTQREQIAALRAELDSVTGQRELAGQE